MNPYIRLAEAIERGAKLRPQSIFGPFTNGFSCAMGAAYEAMTGGTDIEGYTRFNFGVSSSVVYSIICKNDYQRMTREEIAQWLRTLPEAQDTQPSTANPIAAPSPEGVGQGEAASQWATEQVKKLLEGVAA